MDPHPGLKGMVNSHLGELAEHPSPLGSLASIDPGKTLPPRETSPADPSPTCPASERPGPAWPL
jgi:hypothetical protein